LIPLLDEENTRNYFDYKKKQAEKNLLLLWEIRTIDTPSNYNINYNNSKWRIYIYNGDKKSIFPEYFQIRITNLKDNIEINYSVQQGNEKLKYSKREIEYDTETTTIFVNSDYLDEIKPLIKDIVNKILNVSDKKDYYLSKIMKIFKWLEF